MFLDFMRKDFGRWKFEGLGETLIRLTWNGRTPRKFHPPKGKTHLRTTFSWVEERNHEPKAPQKQKKVAKTQLPVPCGLC